MRLIQFLFICVGGSCIGLISISFQSQYVIHFVVIWPTFINEVIRLSKYIIISRNTKDFIHVYYLLFTNSYSRTFLTASIECTCQWKQTPLDLFATFDNKKCIFSLLNSFILRHSFNLLHVYRDLQISRNKYI